MARRKKPARPAVDRTDPNVGRETPALRIIGGSLGGRKLIYNADERTRPMKDRVREAVFNLVGPAVAGKQAVDLFAGTGALGLEAISRGASRATFIEQHFPTARAIRKNAALLGVAERSEVHSANAFIWIQRHQLNTDEPWLVFCSPPFVFYVERQVEMLQLVGRVLESAPQGSIFVVESDERFDMGLLPDAGRWDIRSYPPAIVAIYRK